MKDLTSSHVPVLSSSADQAVRVLPLPQLQRIRSFFDALRERDPLETAESRFKEVPIAGTDKIAVDITNLEPDDSEETPLYSRLRLRTGRRKIDDPERPLVVILRKPRGRGSAGYIIERIVRESLDEVVAEEEHSSSS